MAVKHKKCLHVVVMLWIFNATGDSYVVKEPADAEVLVGDSTFLNCSIADVAAEVSWFHYQVGDGAQNLKYVYTNGQLFEPYNKRFRIENDSSTGTFNLVINSVIPQDAGLYVCQNGLGLWKSAFAQIIVLESNPLCTSNIQSSGLIGTNKCGSKSNTIRLTCGANYTGNFPPKLQWTRIKHNNSYPIPESCSVSQGRIICSYTAEAGVDIDGSSFMCQTHRSRNIRYKCSTETAKTIHVTVNVTRTAKAIGDVIICYVNTSTFNCNYKWIWYDGDHQFIASENEKLEIERKGLYRCQVNCTSKEMNCAFDVMKIEASDVAEVSAKEAVNWLMIHTSLLGGILFFCICICLTGGILLRRFCKMDNGIREVETNVGNKFDLIAEKLNAYNVEGDPPDESDYADG